MPMTVSDRAATVTGGADRFPVRIWLISLAGWMFDFYDLVLFSFLLIPIGRDLHLASADQAVLLGVALGASGLGGILFGYLADLYGRRRVMTWTILVYSLGTALTALSTGYWSVLVFRLITGLGVGGEWAVGHALLAESSPSRMRGRAAAMLQSGEPIGVALAAVVGFMLAPVIGWRAVLLGSSATVLLAYVARRHLPESRLWTEQKEVQLSPGAALRLIWKRGLVTVMMRGWLLGVFKMGTYWTCYTWLPKFLQEQFHQPVGRSTIWMLTAQLGQLLGMLAFGTLADRFGRRVLFAGYSLLTAVSLYPLAFHWEWLLTQPVLFWGALFGLGLGSGCTAGFGALLAELFPTDIRNFSMGTTYNMARAVQFFAPVVVNRFVVAYGLAGGLSVPLVLALATATWVWTLPETRLRDLAAIPSAGDRG
jgi:MFS family permease